MGFLIAGLLVLDLAVTLVSTQLLERKTLRLLCEMQELLLKTKTSLGEVNSSMAILTHKLTGLNDERKKTEEAALEWGTKVTETFQMMAVRLNEMPSRQDLTEAFKQLENLPAVLSREQEGAMSKADAEIMKRTLLDLAHGVEILPDLMKALQKDSAQTFARLEALLENAPDVLGQEDEARLSGSMEEGISNLLQYQVGKRREQS